MVSDFRDDEVKEYISMAKARRFGPLQKRALVVALKAMKTSGIDKPDMILNGTLLGCIDNSLKILDGMVAEGESVSMPTAFMQSTHNAVASMIANYTNNHAYNATYSHGVVSFECALHDAFLHLRIGKYSSALVCKNDEIPDALKQNTELFGNIPICDISEAWMLTTMPENVEPLFEIEGVEILHSVGNDKAIIKKKML